MRIDILDKVEQASGRLEKEDLLSQVDRETVEMLRWALDPIITFGVTVDETDYELSKCVEPDFWKSFDRLLQKLSSRTLTGNAAKDEIFRLLCDAPSKACVKWACRILNKDLRCGFQVSTLNKAFPGTINPFACSLAKPYDPERHEIRGLWCVQPKLDGLRMIVYRGQAFTRNGRTIETVGHILSELKNLSKDWVFDGEIMGSTEFNEDSGKIRKKGAGENKDLVYNIFDMMPVCDWDGRCSESLFVRRTHLESLVTESKNVKVVKSIDLDHPTTQELFDARDEFIKQGYEGAMLKDLNSNYSWKRSDDLLKLKTFFDADGTIAEVYEGRGRLRGLLGGLKVSFDGVVSGVGSGFSDSQREEFWKNQSKIIGKCVEVKYQEKTPDGLLRFPVFIKFRPDKD